MNYVSTRGNGGSVSAAEAIKTGLASDGGLFMPELIPTLTTEEILSLIPLSYAERAARIMHKFLEDYTYDELIGDTNAAYSEKKFGNHPAPVTKLGEKSFMLELWHGPTCAFKDMALQIMPRLFVRALKKTGEDKLALILVATSGDTGKAALEGYRDVPGTKIKVFYPVDGVSRVQKLQMQTQEGENVSVSAIVGNFDDAQSGVKKIFSDKNFAKELADNSVFLSSANSINWGRLLPQIVYYVSAYCDLVSDGEVTVGEKIDVCVPTGNFGNIFAGFLAKKMGLPIEKLVCASNVNNVLTDFLESGTYDKNRVFHTTMSPSMDILISSNLERLLYLTAGPVRTAEYMAALAKDGKYTLSPEDFAKIKENFVGYYTDEEETKKTVHDVYKNKNCLVDTHTAVALAATDKFMNENKAERKILTVSTASAYKFAKDVYLSLTANEPSGDIEALEELFTLTGVAIPEPLKSVLNKEVRHIGIIEKEQMEKSVLDFAKL